MSTSLDFTLTHAIIILTNCLVETKAYDLQSIHQLRICLHGALTTLFADTWDPSNPTFGHGRRCLTLSPDCLPPRALYSACLASGVQWFDWIARLGGKPFYLFIDPGKVSMKLGSSVELITLWPKTPTAVVAPPIALESADEHELQARLRAQVAARAALHVRRDLQTYLDSEDEKRFGVFAKGASTRANFLIRPSSPMSDISISDSSDSGRSFTESVSSTFSVPSLFYSPPPRTATCPPSKNILSRRERARLNRARLHVDMTRTEVVPYGQTNLLSGGVMLGKISAAAPAFVPASQRSLNDWRFAYA